MQLEQQSAIVDNAIDKLLDCNLSSKYALTGRLRMSQVVYYFFYSASDTEAVHYDVRVCVCLFVCLSVCGHIFGHITSNLHQIFWHVTHDNGSVLLWQHSNTLRTSGFMDDVIFAHNFAKAARHHRSAEAQLTCRLGLGYKWHMGISVAVNVCTGLLAVGFTRPQWAC